MAWEYANHSISGQLFYVHSYTKGTSDSAFDNRFVGSKIENMMTTNLQYQYQFTGSLDSTLVLGCINCFDDAPANNLSSTGFDGNLYDPRGQMLYLEWQQFFN